MDRRRFGIFYLSIHAGILLIAAVLYAVRSSPFLSLFFSCPVTVLLHLYCPFCGCTRAAFALLSGKLLLSLSLNPTVFVLALTVLYFEIAAIRTWISGDRLYLSRARLWVLFIPLGVAVLTCVVRNILLVNGIADNLGALAAYYGIS